MEILGLLLLLLEMESERKQNNPQFFKPLHAPSLLLGPWVFCGWTDSARAANPSRAEGRASESPAQHHLWLSN